jgi:ABC-type transport system involved in cytochrome c biogenesis permease subunit
MIQMRLNPTLSLFLFALFAGAPLLRADAPSAGIDANTLATLAVQDHGRKKPFTTFAQEALLTMAGTSALPAGPDAGEGTEPITANEVLLDLWLKPDGWDKRPLIMVTFRALKEKLGLPLETDKKLFTYDELIKSSAFNALLNEAQQVRQAGDADKLTNLDKEAEHLGERLRLFQDCVNGEREAIVPAPSDPNGRWVPIQNLGTVDAAPWPPVDQADRYYIASDSRAQAAGQAFTAWAGAYRSGDISRFNELTPGLVQALASLSPTVYPAAGMLKFEHTYMTVHPFRKAWIVYLCAILVLLLTAIWKRSAGYRLTWLLVLTGLGFEAYGFFCRIVISGRPPVTNMYETVIWVSFGAMVFAVILESIYRKRFFFYAGIPASILALIVADSQPTILDTSINPLTAVLRNNMWLTIHVLTIVSSYAAFALTAALGHIALVMSLWGRRYKASAGEVQFFIYRAMQIGVLLLAAGTILGGVWANYSWGRFWGWDPKETWALITLLCYLALLHGRLAGWWSGYGLAVGSVVCFLSVLMSWYGVNFVLGKGLHSYGFGTGGFSYVATFAVFEALFVAFVVVWNRTHPAAPPPAASSSQRREPALKN